jgi:hypothetical protein
LQKCSSSFLKKKTPINVITKDWCGKTVSDLPCVLSWWTSCVFLFRWIGHSPLLSGLIAYRSSWIGRPSLFYGLTMCSSQWTSHVSLLHRLTMHPLNWSFIPPTNLWCVSSQDQSCIPSHRTNHAFLASLVLLIMDGRAAHPY